MIEAEDRYILVAFYGDKQVNNPLLYGKLEFSTSDLYVIDLETNEVHKIGDIIDSERNKKIYESLPTTKFGKFLGKKLNEKIND